MNEFRKQSDNQPEIERDLLSIAELYPELSPAEQEEAAYFLNRFLEVMHRIFEENQRKTGDWRFLI